MYLAGREVGWNAMAHLPESRSFPLYAKAYRELIKRVLEGEALAVDRPPALEEKTGPVLTREAVGERIRDLKALFDGDEKGC